MSCFDTIWLACPHCHERTSIQSKAGKCELREFEQLVVPTIIAAEEQRIPHECEQCGKRYFLLAQVPTRTSVVGVKEWHEGVDPQYDDDLFDEDSDGE